MDMVLSPANRYLPTDTEVLICLKRKLRKLDIHPDIIIHEKDVYSADPWNLLSEAEYHHDTGDGAFFYTKRHCTGTGSSSRANRNAGSGYWHGNSHTDSIFVYADETKTDTVKIGCKAALAFKKNPNPNPAEEEDWPPETGEWIMHEFRLDGNKNFAICRIHRILKPSNKRQRQKEVVDQYYYHADADDDQQAAADVAVINQPAFKRPRVLPAVAPMMLIPSPSSSSSSSILLQETCRSTEGGGSLMSGHRQEMMIDSTHAQTAPYLDPTVLLFFKDIYMHSRLDGTKSERLYLNQPPAMVDKSRACISGTLPALPAEYWEGTPMVCVPPPPELVEATPPDPCVNFMVVCQQPACDQPPGMKPSQTTDEDLRGLGNLPAPLHQEEDCSWRDVTWPEQPADAFDLDTMLGKESCCRLEGDLAEYFEDTLLPDLLTENPATPYTATGAGILC